MPATTITRYVCPLCEREYFRPKPLCDFCDGVPEAKQVPVPERESLDQFGRSKIKKRPRK